MNSNHNEKKGSHIFIYILVTVVLIGATALIASGVWDREEPSVPVSYYTDELNTQIDETVDKILEEKLVSVDADIDDKLESYQQVVDEKFNSDEDFAQSVVNSAVSQIENAEGYTYAEVTLAEGELISVDKTCEIVPVSGTCTIAGDESSIASDLSIGAPVTVSNTELTNSHLYIVTSDGCSISASSDAVIYIKGKYGKLDTTTNETTQE